MNEIEKGEKFKVKEQIPVPNITMDKAQILFTTEVVIREKKPSS